MPGAEREERKLGLSPSELVVLRLALRRLLLPDPHGRDGAYQVRSLYFDDPQDSALHLKLAGLHSRHKWRLRRYDLPDALPEARLRIRLERKVRRGRRVYKDTALVSAQTARALVEGATPPKGEDLVDTFVVEARARSLRPVVIVDYLREAFVYPVQSLRVTLDQRLHASAWRSWMAESWLDATLPLRAVPCGPILEVKSTGGLPCWVADVLPRRALADALSKYVLCRHLLMGRE